MRSHICLISVGHKLQQEGEKEAVKKSARGKERQLYEAKAVGEEGERVREGQVHYSDLEHNLNYILSLHSSSYFF